MTNKKCNVEVYKNGEFSARIFRPTLKKAREFVKEAKISLSDEENLITDFKIKKI